MLTLTEFFELQSTLNKRVGLDDQKFADRLSGTENRYPFDVGVLIEAGRWIDDMLKAMSSEMEELRNCTFWKHWCSEAQSGERYRIKDVGAARNEVIDILHFWISLAQILGMSPEMVSDMYEAKLAKNIKRQDDGYSIEVKDLALYLWQRYPDDNPIGYSGLAESLEDMPDEVAAFYLGWAKKEAKNQCRMTDVHCDCISMDYLTTPHDPSLIDNPQPQPDPDCKKCNGSGYKNTGESK
ncbi:dUTPase [Candidatus Pacearchaeota archaeon]|nr:dUTPase [Candidatus Pacearchaeota archaeon]